MKTTITLGDRDWGRVASAIEHALGFVAHGNLPKWVETARPLTTTIEPWSWQKAEAKFLRRFDSLTTERPKFSERIFTAEVLKSPERYPTGCIVGTVEIVDCVTASDSPWFMGDFGFVLRNPISFETPIPCRGALMLWDVPAALLPVMREQYRQAKSQAVSQ